MLCPYCMEIQDEAPSIFGEGPCSPPHCFKPSCCMDCPECSDWFQAIEPEEGKVKHPKSGAVEKPGIPEKEPAREGREMPREGDRMVGDPPAHGIKYEGRMEKTDWPTFTVTEEFVAWAKKWRAEIDKKWKDNYLAYDTGTRYTGKVAEEVLKFYWDNTPPGAVCKTSSKFKDIYDFDWNGLIVNAKCIVFRTKELRPYYACNVNKAQDDKRACNAYVFVHFNDVTRECHIVGWIRLEKWDALKVLRPAGVKVTEKFTPNADLFECKIYDLTPIDTLEEKPIKEPEKKKAEPAKADTFEKYQKPQPKADQGDIPW